MAQRVRIDGVYELGHVLYALDAETNGFARGDVARIERFWHSGEMHSSTAGFVLQLRDGRRVYVDFLHWHGFEQDEDFRIEAEFLEPGPGLAVAARPRPLANRRLVDGRRASRQGARRRAPLICQRHARQMTVRGLAEQTVHEHDILHLPLDRFDVVIRHAMRVAQQGHMRREGPRPLRTPVE